MVNAHPPSAVGKHNVVLAGSPAYESIGIGSLKLAELPERLLSSLYVTTGREARFAFSRSLALRGSLRVMAALDSALAAEPMAEFPGVTDGVFLKLANPAANFLSDFRGRIVVEQSGKAKAELNAFRPFVVLRIEEHVRLGRDNDSPAQIAWARLCAWPILGVAYRERRRGVCDEVGDSIECRVGVQELVLTVRVFVEHIF
ncbi:MAG: hypothetical protein AAGE52_17610 [Myxococcota bacterium]